MRYIHKFPWLQNRRLLPVMVQSNWISVILIRHISMETSETLVRSHKISTVLSLMRGPLQTENEKCGNILWLNWNWISSQIATNTTGEHWLWTWIGLKSKHITCELHWILTRSKTMQFFERKLLVVGGAHCNRAFYHCFNFLKRFWYRKICSFWWRAVTKALISATWCTRTLPSGTNPLNHRVSWCFRVLFNLPKCGIPNHILHNTELALRCVYT